MNTLVDLSIGQRARVTRIIGDNAISTRLLEMGLTPGVELKLINTAPLGDPLELEVRGYRLSVRRTEATLIEIQPSGVGSGQ